MSAPKQIRVGAKRSSHPHRWMRWRMFITLIGGLAIAWPLACYAQQPKGPVKRVGILARDSPCPLQPDDLRRSQSSCLAHQNPYGMVS